MAGPYPYRLTRALATVEQFKGQDDIRRTVSLEGTVDGVNVDFDIPGSDEPHQQIVAGDFTAYADGAPDGGAVFAEGAGTGGKDRITFSVAPTTSAQADVLQGVPLNLGEFEIETETEQVERVSLGRSLDARAPIPGARSSRARFSLPLMGLGTGLIPPVVAVLQGAGFEPFIEGTDFAFQLTDQDPKSLTLYAWLGATLRKMTGAHADFTVDVQAGQPATVNATVAGAFHVPVDKGYPAGLQDPPGEEPIAQVLDLTLGYAGATPVIDNGGGYGTGDTALTVDDTTGLSKDDLLSAGDAGELMRVDSVDSGTQLTVTRGVRGTVAAALADGQQLKRVYRVVCPRFSLSLGNDLSRRADVNSAHGIHSQNITGRAPTGTFTVEQVSEAERGFFDEFLNGARVPLGFSIGLTPGERVAVMLPAARLSVIEDVEVDGFWHYTLTYALEPVEGVGAVKIKFY